MGTPLEYATLNTHFLASIRSLGDTKRGTNVGEQGSGNRRQVNRSTGKKRLAIRDWGYKGMRKQVDTVDPNIPDLCLRNP
jgi:hypothetical protein